MALNELTRIIAAEDQAVVVEMGDHPVNDRPDLFGADGVHFADVGQQ